MLPCRLSASVVVPAAVARRSLSSSVPLAVRQPDEWSYPSREGDNKPRRPFLNPDVTDKIPNTVAIRAGLPPYRLPSANIDIYEYPPQLPRTHDILTHTITFKAWDNESLIPYNAMARHCALALLIPVTGPTHLPNIVERWKSNRSAFVHSNSKEIFERRTYTSKIDVWDADDKAVEVMIKIILASGRGEHVKVTVEKYTTSSFEFDVPAVTETKPLTRKSSSLVQSLADRFVRESFIELEHAERRGKGSVAGTEFSSLTLEDLDPAGFAKSSGEVTAPSRKSSASKKGPHKTYSPLSVLQQLFQRLTTQEMTSGRRTGADLERWQAETWSSLLDGRIDEDDLFPSEWRNDVKYPERRGRVSPKMRMLMVERAKAERARSLEEASSVAAGRDLEEGKPRVEEMEGKEVRAALEREVAMEKRAKEKKKETKAAVKPSSSPAGAALEGVAIVPEDQVLNTLSEEDVVSSGKKKDD